MSKHHSTISRRDFLKILGLGGAGLGAAAVSPPVFHDLDELMASPQADFKRPFWVKEVDKPTVEIDWGIMKRFNYFEVMWAGGFRKAWGKEKEQFFIKLGAANRDKWLKENKPGYTLRDAALSGCSYGATTTFLGPRTSPTPESLGVPRWEGTLEENARMVRAFLKLHGACHVGFVELDTNTTEKLIYSYDAAKGMSVQGPRLDILDVDEPVDAPEDPVTGGGGYRIIPKKARWVIVYTLLMSPELIHRAPSLIAGRREGYIYDLRPTVQGQLQNFVRTLGYMALGDTVPYAALGVATGFAVMAGLGETCRVMPIITPDYGLMQRVFIGLVTDLPLAPGKPVDFGVTKFCRTCKKCAEYCPAQALPHDTDPGWEIRGPYQNYGVRIWRRDEPKCRAYIYEVGSCAICFAVCPYSKIHKTTYTSAWQATVATTPVLNRFFRRMDDFLGYGLKTGENIEDFWQLDLPPWGWE